MDTGRSISKPPYWDGTTNFNEWKESIIIFMQSIDYKLWLVTKNGSKIPTKSEDQFNDEEMKIMEQEAKAKYILRCALNPVALQRISGCQTAKEIWEKFNNVVTESDSDVYSTPRVSLARWSNDTYPNREFLDETGNHRFLHLCVPFHKLVLKGNWPEANRMMQNEQKLKNYAITKGWLTVLHIAAGANHIHFVKELLKILDDNDIKLKDINGNTAFCNAAAAGNIKIVDLMFERNRNLPGIRGENGYYPIQFAALQGKSKMTWHLYDKTEHCFEDYDRKLLFFACINSGIYDLALKMVRERNELAFVRDMNTETALHLLAQIKIPLDYGMTNHMVSQLVKFLWITIVDKHNTKSELNEIINYPSQLIFDAAEVGNFRFLSELISVDTSLIWDLDSKNRTIIHIAVLHRHPSILRFLREIGHINGIILTYEDDERNTILHLAAKLKLTPRCQLRWASGPAAQMWIELKWFEKVKKIMMPALINSRNSDGLTAEELFSVEHEKLRESAELWMKKTAEYCMLIVTVVAAAVFTAATSLLGGTNDDTNDDTGKPYLKKIAFLVFAISDAFAFISSSTAILIFFSILTTPYGEYDVYKSLPLKLVFGVFALHTSITSMMVAFSSSFYIIYYHGSKFVPISITILSFSLILVSILLELSTFSDIIKSINRRRTLSKADKNMIMY